MLKLWGRVNSINVMKVLWLCDEASIRFDRVDAGMAFGVVTTPEYKAMNPNARVPTIDDDGFVLWESNAIVRYLAAKHASALLPATLPGRADADRWMDWSATTIAGPMLPVFWQLVRTPPDKRDPAVINAARDECAKAWTLLDAHLASRAFVCGEAITVGDIPLGCYVHRWFALLLERPTLPHLTAWYERLKTRPAYQRTVMIPLT